MSSWSVLGCLLLAAAASAQLKPPAPSAPAATPIPPTEAVLDTPRGEIVIRLLPELAPRHVAFFLKTAKAGGYTGTTFHRVIRNAIIQGGDPLTKDRNRASQYGTGGLGLLRPEFSDRDFKRGVVAAVLRPRDPNSGGSQFFICLADQPSLKGQYTIFGEVVAGIEVADRIGETPADGDKAKERVEIRKVTLREVAAGS